MYRSLGAEAPDVLAEPIKRQPVRALVLPPTAYLNVKVDGRESTYFEWMGAGLYSADRRSSAMHGRLMLLHEIRYGFDEKRFHLRVDVFSEALKELRDAEFRITFRAEQELRVVVRLEGGRVTGYLVESRDLCLLGPDEVVKVAFDRILEVSVAKEMFFLGESKIHFARRGAVGRAACPWTFSRAKECWKSSSARKIARGPWVSHAHAISRMHQLV